jgi:DNA-binding transcriptional LysR family regulator
MRKDELTDLYAFAIVAEEQSFTRAAARLNMSASALSHAINRLENRLGLRLLVRTTRSVAPNFAGIQLLSHLTPALEGIEMGLDVVAGLRSKPSGTIRLTASEHASETVLWPALQDWILQFPDVEIEISVDARFTNVIGERFDAGVRIGEAIDRDMIAVRIGPALRLVVVAAPSYLERHGAPTSPADLSQHSAINLRFPGSGRIHAWEFEIDNKTLRITPRGQLIFDSTRLVLRAALAGFGLAMMMEDDAAPYVESGALKLVLGEWVKPFPGYYLYYPNRKQHSAAFSLLLDHLRYK